MKFSSLILVSLIFSFKALAASPDIRVGEVSYGGIGCPAQSIESEENNSKIGIINFKDFKLSTRKGVERKACSLLIPLEVPKGIQVGIGPIYEMSGFISLPSSTSRLTINQESFFAGTKGKVIRYVKKGEKVGALKVENATLLKDLRWSACGQSVNLRVHVTALLENPTRKLAFVHLDSLNVLKTSRLYWRNCQ